MLDVLTLSSSPSHCALLEQFSTCLIGWHRAAWIVAISLLGYVCKEVLHRVLL